MGERGALSGEQRGESMDASALNGYWLTVTASRIPDRTSHIEHHISYLYLLNLKFEPPTPNLKSQTPNPHYVRVRFLDYLTLP